ncbi:hypothetical protein CY34DRAFT_608787 [Suillus luteus UH-Slu-Lm8-n1]|uniref:Uncharacterized protein n=1 Tax=Suillus luteus UH-Slu-Lm8-n1 TaxID=930992 RepID=A0A0D0ASF9_9AGAM|nr:hypothetical protein CY34DRAFT_608787 [Suillus luteus UH-Slu-Lm8-n1]
MYRLCSICKLQVCFIQVQRNNKKDGIRSWVLSQSRFPADPPRSLVPAFIRNDPNSALDSLCINLRSSMCSRGRREQSK